MKMYGLALLMVFGSFAGCIQEPQPLPIDGLTVSSSASYVGTDGTRLRVIILGIETVFDEHMYPKSAVLVRFELRPVLTGATHEFIEAVDQETGLNLQWVFRCDQEASQRDSDVRCLPDNARVFLSAAGLPGFFGMGPSVARGSHAAGTSSFPVRVAVDTDADAFLESKTNQSNPACLDHRWNLPREALSGGFTPILHVSDGAVRTCGAVPFPVFFKPSWRVPDFWGAMEEVSFTLQEYSIAPGPSIFTGRPEGIAREGDHGPLWPLREFADGPALLYSDPAEAPARIQEAHAFAKKGDSRYRSISDDPDAVLVATGVTSNHLTMTRELLDIVRKETFERQLVLDSSSGDAREVIVEETKVYRNDRYERSEWRLAQASDHEAREWPANTSRSRYVDPADVWRDAPVLLGRNAWLGSYMRFKARPSDVAGPFGQELSVPLLTYYAEAPAGDRGMEMATVALYVNGATGGLIGLDVPDSRMPFGPGGGWERLDASR